MRMKTACVAALLLASTIIATAQENEYVSAKKLFYADLPKAPVKHPGPKRPHGTGTQQAGQKPAPFGGKISYSPDAGPANTGLKYQIIQRSPNGIGVPVDPDTSFHSGDRIRFSFESNMDGFLYVVQQGSSGKWTVLFPDPQINQGMNSIKRGSQYDVPLSKWFKFDPNPGTERVMVFLSKSPLKDLPGFERPVTSVTTVNQSVVDELNSSVNSRDLVFEKDTAPAQNELQPHAATYVVNHMGQAVVATIVLNHN